MERTARLWAGLDLIITGLLAVPPTASRLIELIYWLSGKESQTFAGAELFFVCLAGVLGVVWATARIRVPIPELIRLDVIGRVGVSAMIVWFVLFESAPEALLLFITSELVGAVHQGLELRRAARSS